VGRRDAGTEIDQDAQLARHARGRRLVTLLRDDHGVDFGEVDDDLR
jgi:hypothetical protein